MVLRTARKGKRPGASSGDVLDIPPARALGPLRRRMMVVIAPIGPIGPIACAEP